MRSYQFRVGPTPICADTQAKKPCALAADTVMHPQDEELTRFAGNNQNRDVAKKESSPRAFKESVVLPTT